MQAVGGDNRTRTRGRGFTLVEMLVVVTLLAVVASLVVPRMGDARITRLRAAAGMLAADIEYAQTLTVTRSGDPCVIVFEPDDNRYYLARNSTIDTPIAEPNGGGDYIVRFNTDGARPLAGVSLGNLSVGGDDELSFGPFGQLDQTADATIQITAAGRSITLTLDASTGQVTIGHME